MAVVNVPVVNVPAAAAVPPIAGGDARYVLKPVPLTVLEADNVVNAPVDAVVAPTVVPLMDPPVIAELDEPKLFAVTKPAVEIVIAVTAPAFPTLKIMLSDDPTPVVDCKVRVEPTPVPP